MVLNINSKIEGGKYDGKTINSILKSNKKEIFNLIKEGYIFDDEVLALAGIVKKIKSNTFKQIVVDHDSDNKIYEKDTMSVAKIINDISTIDKMNYKEFDESEKCNTDDNDEINDGEII